MKRVMEVVGKYGDKAATYIWQNIRDTLAVSATLAAFLANPEPFINGTKQLDETVAKDVVTPVPRQSSAGGAKVADSGDGACGPARRDGTLPALWRGHSLEVGEPARHRRHSVRWRLPAASAAAGIAIDTVNHDAR